MARTRTSDPGRDSALHYAAASRQRHAKRLVYAGFRLVVLALTAVHGAGPTAAAAPQQTVPHGPRESAAPCAACQVLSISPEQVSLIPESLNGLSALVRLTAGDAAGSWKDVLQTIRRRGGRPGVHILGVPGPEDPALSGFGDVLVIEVGSGDADQIAFGLKRSLTAARGGNTRAMLQIAGDPDVISALRERGLASYVDS